MEYAPSDDSRRADGERYHVTYTNLYLQAVSDQCDIDQSAFGQNSYTGGPWHNILMYYWDPADNPVLSGND